MNIALSVVAPCFNEAKNLSELVDRLLRTFERRGLEGEVVLVDDGSTDDTAAVMERLRAADSARLTIVRHPANQGIVPAWRSGIAVARGRYACLIDADLQNLPEDVWRLYREITLTGADLVQGYRSTIGRPRDSRYLLSVGLNTLLNRLFGMHQHDSKSGFVIAERETLEDVLRHRLRYHYFQTFITVAAAAKGYSVREIETIFQERLLGESFINQVPARVVLRSLVDLAKGFVEFRIGRKQETILADYLRDHPPARADEPLRGWRQLWMELFFATMPLHKWMISRRARDYYHELKRSQWLGLAEMRELQEKKLRRLVQHAYRHVGYYRQRFDDLGLAPGDIQTLDDVGSLPLLSKSDVRENLYFDLLSDNHDKRRIQRVTTSGSTGEPFVCYADQHQLEIRWAATQRSLEWTGWRFGDPSARLWHQTLGMSRRQIVKEHIDAWFNRRLFIPAFELSDARIVEMIDRLRRRRPVLIDGYAESFNFLARHLRQGVLDGVRPKGIVSSAQALPEQSRDAIEAAFGCRVFDKYGSREFSGIAYECEAHAGHHVVAENYIVEILKDGVPARPGEMGEVVVTDLNNFCMPLIRYRIGDLAMAMDPDEPCPCGRGLPRIGRIEGRVQAIIVGSNGTYMPGTFFQHLFKDYEHLVRQFQVVQHERGAMELKIVKGPRFEPEAFGEVVATLRQFLGDDMRIDVVFVDRIPMVRTGKHQAAISHLPIDLQRDDVRLGRATGG
jgi:phenylacetate-CoA ligase